MMSANQANQGTNSSPTILVIGATGKCGLATIKSLYANFRDRVTIRAGVRDVEKAKQVFQEQHGIDIVVADSNIPNSLQSALTGVDAVYICTPTNGNGRAEAVATITSACKAANVKFILLTGVPVDYDPKFIFGREWGGMEDRIKATGISYCFLQLPFFCENFWGHEKTIKEKKAIYAPADINTQFNYIAVHDIGLASAFILANYSQHKNKTYLLTGPSTISHAEIIKLLQPIVGNISYYRTTKEQTIDSVGKTWGLLQWNAEGIVQLWERCENSVDGKDARAISHDFEQITGRKPMSYAQFIESIAPALK